MKTLAWIPLVASLVLAGCGGGGSHAGSSTDPKAAVRSAIVLAIGYDRNASSGIHKSGIGKAKASRRSVHLALARTSKATRDVEGPYYDDLMELWKTVSTDGNVETTLYWIDEAATKAAGTRVTVYPDGDGYPSTISSTYRITAGPATGTSGTSADVSDGEDAWHSVGDDSFPDGSVLHSTEAHSEGGTFSWGYDETFRDGSRFRVAGTFGTDGSGSMSATSPDGTTTTIDTHRDGDGEGTVEQDADANDRNPEMPATFDWTADGTTTVRYADGTSQTYSPS